MLKILIAAACMVVIAAVGYFVLQDQQDRARQAELDDQRMCDVMLSDLKSGNKTRDWRLLHVNLCVTKGYLTKEQFDTPDLQYLLDQAVK